MVTRCSLYNIRMSLSLASNAIIYQNGSIYATAIARGKTEDNLLDPRNKRNQYCLYIHCKHVFCYMKKKE